MAKRNKQEAKSVFFCRDCKLHFGEYSHPVVNGKYDTSRNILCRCPYTTDAKLLDHENCKRIEL